MPLLNFVDFFATRCCLLTCWGAVVQCICSVVFLFCKSYPYCLWLQWYSLFAAVWLWMLVLIWLYFRSDEPTELVQVRVPLTLPTNLLFYFHVYRQHGSWVVSLTVEWIGSCVYNGSVVLMIPLYCQETAVLIGKQKYVTFCRAEYLQHVKIEDPPLGCLSNAANLGRRALYCLKMIANMAIIER